MCTAIRCLIRFYCTAASDLIFSTEDMAFEFKKAFQKATELRSLTFAQQWTMTDDSVFNSEQPVQENKCSDPLMFSLTYKFNLNSIQNLYD